MSAPQNITIHRTYQVRGYTSRSGYARIREVLGVCQRLYNRALAERKAVYRMTGKSMGKYAQMKWLTGLRRSSRELAGIALSVERGALIRLDRAFQAFFRRVKAGEKPGFPRFKPWQRYQCIELAEVTPAMLKGNRIKVKGLPTIRIRPSRPLPERKPVSMRLIMHGRKLTVDLVYCEQVAPLPPSDASVGIDMGVHERMTFSTDETVARREIDRKRERRLQRAISRKRKGSNSRRKAIVVFAREKRKNAVWNRNECHRITTDLVRRFGRIAVEGLRIQNMTRAGGSHTTFSPGGLSSNRLPRRKTRKRGLNREVIGQTWGMIRQQLAYKAEWAGRQLVEVNPAYTSRTCSACGEVQSKPRVYRLFECSDCGHSDDRDVNAAKNILARGRELAAGSVTVEVVDSCRAARKICDG